MIDNDKKEFIPIINPTEKELNCKNLIREGDEFEFKGQTFVVDRIRKHYIQARPKSWEKSETN